MCSGVPMHNLCLICVTDIRIPDDRSVPTNYFIKIYCAYDAYVHNTDA